MPIWVVGPARKPFRQLGRMVFLPHDSCAPAHPLDSTRTGQVVGPADNVRPMGNDDQAIDGLKPDQRAEEDVRRYLMFLEDPESLVDRTAAGDARRAALEKPDPIDRLLALEVARRMETVDRDSVRGPFLKSVKPWALSVGVHHDTLLSAGVPRQDLADAGFQLDQSEPTAAVRRQRVSIDDVVREALNAGRPLSVQDLVNISGASTGTVRKAIGAMLKDGRLVEDGPDPEWSSRGKPPQRYSTPR